MTVRKSQYKIYSPSDRKRIVDTMKQNDLALLEKVPTSTARSMLQRANEVEAFVRDFSQEKCGSIDNLISKFTHTLHPFLKKTQLNSLEHILRPILIDQHMQINSMAQALAIY